MKELTDLGVDTSNAIFAFIPSTKDPEVFKESFRKWFGDEIPTFTLQDILNMLPTHQTFSDVCDDGFGRFWVRLVDEECDDIHTEMSNKSLLDAAYKMLKWIAKEK